jgi:hypothetical protein
MKVANVKRVCRRLFETPILDRKGLEIVVEVREVEYHIVNRLMKGIKKLHYLGLSAF